MLQDFRVGVRQAMAIEGVWSRSAVGTSAVLLLAHWAVILRFVTVRSGDLNFLRLHYGVAFGIDWYDRWWFIFTFPVLGSVILALNGWMAFLLVRLRPAFATMIHVATTFIQLALVAAGSIAVLLNS
jgi:hypothetical protein